MEDKSLKNKEQISKNSEPEIPHETAVKNIKKSLEGLLTPKRFKHSINVFTVAKTLAKRYGADRNKIEIAALLHDCAKDLSVDEIKSYNLEFDEVTKLNPKLVHANIGALMVEKTFNIKDPDIINAVKYHTTARKNMSIYEKIIYLADFIEPDRDFSGLDRLSELSYTDIDKAMVYGLSLSIKWLVDAKKLIHPNTFHARNFLLSQIDALNDSPSDKK